ncbi:GNAT family N-acetyltransferase [Photorhabdus khanii]|uniref:N-acetyltransferase n=1 Tax=Photorhabdus khanii subsp. guanajuatensis TaxID=2100166 RepID=A0A4R4K646_9GAMM|nr:GNAT family N-acetyltransferase [Photorhabdus khanii]TDB62132.1 N-acetyltransferase [Photorhabdus khanii subsp. guanajuatensis]
MMKNNNKNTSFNKNEINKFTFIESKLSNEEVIDIHDIMTNSGEVRPIGYLKLCQHEIKESKRIVLICRHNTEFVGMAHILLISEHTSFNDMGIIELHDLWINPKWRRNGIALPLSRKLEEICHQRLNVKKVGLAIQLYKNNEYILRFYMKIGYKPIDLQLDGTNTVLWMTKEIELC